ncbi:RRS1-domain-containing protein [Hesseltinella vesiculosa]|uniref:Ribosome biogenesis regulatory protein n=1 Tax=Hesseltinella vesiculosa TaxID=101127 RepID=A0A1X2G7N2_9FUNG|nr:RRS1-domain-containing protein [Hesseltinella vesiculosa]
MDVTEILEAHKAQFKPITVEKLVPLDFDLSLLAGFDTNALDDKRLKGTKEAYLKEMTRDNVQLVVNGIFELPVKTSDHGILAELPDRTTVLPREKPLPKEKPMTRWEKFAQTKGIQNRKRERMVWDDDRQEYVPRWGYKGGAKDGTQDWLIEVPNSVDPMTDMYQAKREEKKERVAKNAKRQKRNEEEGAAATMAGKKDVRDLKKDELQSAIAASRTATASMGKFDKALRNEQKVKGVTHQFSSNIGDAKAEKNSSMDILNKIVGKDAKVDVNKAVRMHARDSAKKNFSKSNDKKSDKKFNKKQRK